MSSSLNVVAPRKCGKCTLCCTVMGIEELNKPKHTKCTHQFDGGCGIYKTRPASCSGFMCDWLRGDLSDEDRPDKLGVFFHTKPMPEWGRQVTFCEEGWDGALNDARAKVLLTMKARTQVVLLRRVREKFQVLLGPQAELARIQPLIRQKGGEVDMGAGRQKPRNLNDVIDSSLEDGPKQS